MTHPYLNPRAVLREARWFLAGVALVVAVSALLPTFAAGLLIAILPTFALLSAATRSLLPALLCFVVSLVLASTGTPLAPEVALLGLALGLIFAAQRFVERLERLGRARRLDLEA